jgi:hypothetical protein
MDQREDAHHRIRSIRTTNQLYSAFGRDPAGVSVPPEPLPGRDCVGGYPRPLGLFVMLTAGSITSEPAPATRAQRQRERREHRRLRDERDYYIAMVLSLRHQICGLEELVPPDQRDACLADFERDAARLGHRQRRDEH